MEGRGGGQEEMIARTGWEGDAGRQGPLGSSGPRCRGVLTLQVRYMAPCPSQRLGSSSWLRKICPGLRRRPGDSTSQGVHWWRCRVCSPCSLHLTSTCLQGSRCMQRRQRCCTARDRTAGCRACPSLWQDCTDPRHTGHRPMRRSRCTCLRRRETEWRCWRRCQLSRGSSSRRYRAMCTPSHDWGQCSTCQQGSLCTPRLQRCCTSLPCSRSGWAWTHRPCSSTPRCSRQSRLGWSCLGCHTSLRCKRCSRCFREPSTGRLGTRWQWR
jgi:hypothetical protein